MPERTSYPHGVPTWVDVASPDVSAAAAFYGSLFGWEHQLGENAEATGGYGMFTKDGKLVAGIGPLQMPEQPPAWTTYVSVDDADAVAAKVTEAGGQVAVAPMDIFDSGRMGLFTDTSGAFIGVWQADQHHGAQLVNEPGTLGWNELRTREMDGAQAFYPAVFGWEPAPFPSDDSSGYVVWKVAGDTIGGLMAMDDQWPQEVPAHWAVYFVVEDADETAAKARELGGVVHAEPFDAPDVGRISMLTDPHGAAFAVIALDGPPDE